MSVQSSSSESTESRGRGRYIQTDPRPKASRTIQNEGKWAEVKLLSNYVSIKPMSASSSVYLYRFDFEPPIESTSLRKRVVNELAKTTFKKKLDFDGVSDGRSLYKLTKSPLIVNVKHPTGGDDLVVTIKSTGTVEFGSLEMLRTYNIMMREFLAKMNFFESQRGVFVHQDLATPVANQNMSIVRGFKTAANVHENGKVLMNMEAVHKIVQDKTVLDYMDDLRKNSPAEGLQELLRSSLAGKVVVPSYKLKICYKIQDVVFSKNPTFEFDMRGKQISFIKYFEERHGKKISNKTQPLLLVTKSNQGRREREAALARAGGQEATEMLVPPELCFMAGLTDRQRNDRSLKFEMIKATQLSPSQRVENLDKFLNKMHSNRDVKELLAQWSYGYDTRPVEVTAKLIPQQHVQWSGQPQSVDMQTGSFDHLVGKSKLKVVPRFDKMIVAVSRSEMANWNQKIQPKIRAAFELIGLEVGKVEVKDLPDDRPKSMTSFIKNLPPCDLAMLVLRAQDKQAYDAIKKSGTCELGVPSQVITSRLLCDERKGRGAATKIGIQIAAKLGGEPWHINIPLKATMICGYDTYHDSTKRGRSWGAFVASTNESFSRWWSRVDQHERIEELSTSLAANLANAVKNWADKNDGKIPIRVFMFRDGVSDGQLEHVFRTELKEAKRALRKLKSSEPIKLTFVIVNKRVGARFYLQRGGNYANAQPGTVIDSVVTRQGYYDFYLVSPSTRQGTVSPTYYNVIYDEAGLPAHLMQLIAFKLCFNYYNWTGTVRVPAPCQYAHKLALQAGENTHDVPHVRLSNLLHYL